MTKAAADFSSTNRPPPDPLHAPNMLVTPPATTTAKRSITNSPHATELANMQNDLSTKGHNANKMKSTNDKKEIQLDKN